MLYSFFGATFMKLSKLFGKGFTEPLLKTLEAYYVKAGFATPFPFYLKYMGKVLLATVVFSFLGGLFLHCVILKYALLRAIPASIILSLIFCLISLFLLLYLPLYKSYSRRVDMEKDLPFTASYMTALSSSGMSLERLLEREGLYETNTQIKREILLILRDIKVYGLDTLTALSRAALRSPSRLLTTLWLGLRETYITSGDLKSYLSHYSSVLLSDKVQKLRNATNSISMIAEVYTTVMVAGPLMFVTMLMVMDLLGGTVFGLSPGLLVLILTFIVIPFSAIGVYIAVDGILSRV
jgi:flagellar protein FlaJ